jgi:hypothetical protein
MMGVKQHLVSLQQILVQKECTTVAQLELGRLQFGALAGDDRPVLASVELDGLAFGKAQPN